MHTRQFMRWGYGIATTGSSSSGKEREDKLHAFLNPPVPTTPPPEVLPHIISQAESDQAARQPWTWVCMTTVAFMAAASIAVYLLTLDPMAFQRNAPRIESYRADGDRASMSADDKTLSFEILASWLQGPPIQLNMSENTQLNLSEALGRMGSVLVAAAAAAGATGVPPPPLKTRDVA